MTSLPTALPKESLTVKSLSLFTPPMHEVAKVLEDGLRQNFGKADVHQIQCPDLTQGPFHLAAKGLCGSPRLLDIGGVPYLVPKVNRHKLYDMKDLPVLTNMPGKDQFIIGAGAAPWTFLKRNAELVPNLMVHKDGSINQQSRIAFTVDADGSYRQQILPVGETKIGMLGNLFLSEGHQGPVLEVRCQVRTGQDNFISCMRKILLQAYPEKSIGVGGTFLVKTGKLRVHVMPDFSTCPLNSDDDVAKWLNFYEMSAPFVCTSFFVSQDPGLDLRVEHTHGFSKHGDAGHYHCDTSPETVEYVGYFNLAEECFRIDAPTDTHTVGRD